LYAICSVFLRICAGNNSKRPLFLMSNCWEPYIICSLIFKKWHRFCSARICTFIFPPAQNPQPPPGRPLWEQFFVYNLSVSPISQRPPTPRTLFQLYVYGSPPPTECAFPGKFVGAFVQHILNLPCTPGGLLCACARDRTAFGPVPEHFTQKKTHLGRILSLCASTGCVWLTKAAQAGLHGAFRDWAFVPLRCCRMPNNEYPQELSGLSWVKVGRQTSNFESPCATFFWGGGVVA
jgi:hypothetical protein